MKTMMEENMYLEFSCNDFFSFHFNSGKKKTTYSSEMTEDKIFNETQVIDFKTKAKSGCFC